MFGDTIFEDKVGNFSLNITWELTGDQPASGMLWLYIDQSPCCAKVLIIKNFIKKYNFICIIKLIKGINQLLKKYMHYRNN